MLPLVMSQSNHERAVSSASFESLGTNANRDTGAFHLFRIPEITLMLEFMPNPFLPKWLEKRGLELNNFRIVLPRVVGSFCARFRLQCGAI